MRDQQIKQFLAMSNTDYKSYSDSLRIYDQAVIAVLKNQGLDKNEKNSALINALDKRKWFIERKLTAGQIKKLGLYNKQNMPVSPMKKMQKEMEESLKRKGITVKKV